MDFTLGDALIVAVPVVILLMVLWGVNQAFKPRDFGISDAERYQRELARRSAAHQAEQVQAALAARARATASTTSAASTLPRQNQPNHPERRAPQGPVAPKTGAPASGRLQAVLPDGQLNPDFVRQLQSLARNGQKIQAIKLLRDYTRADLLTAKNYIDRL
ncbi:hypothetical protein [Arthrobacter celericrescens]|uniref:hypothetical protein n=1 Tax=Arthrobacter celericrescens TaxID=2320851 RepID=UPI000EA0447C|nr:hypothetical protein [Arthrobacter celericrescens]